MHLSKSSTLRKIKPKFRITTLSSFLKSSGLKMSQDTSKHLYFNFSASFFREEESFPERLTANVNAGQSSVFEIVFNNSPKGIFSVPALAVNGKIRLRTFSSSL